MLVTDQFVLVHVPKTGGGFLRKAIQESMPARDCGPHLAYRRVPPDFSHLPAVCFRRNPWDWYVSLWAFQRHDGSGETFAQVLERAFRSRPDLYARTFARLAGRDVQAGRIDLGRFEHLREDFVAFLDRHQIETDRLRELVLTAEPVNVSEHGDYHSYYRAESRDLVATSPMARDYEF